MGSYDGAEICELVGLLILHSLEQRFGKNVDLYRDDGLAAIKTTSGRLADKARKDLVRIFDSLGLKISIQTNLQHVNFVDITFDLQNNTYRPYRKPNDDPLYINRLCNHPLSVLQQLPLSINNHINKLSCNKVTFDSTAPLYNDALKQSNFNTKLSYERNNRNNSSSRNRQQNVIWYNPPYSENFRSNIAHDFLQLIDKHFPPSNKLSKLFNRLVYVGQSNSRCCFVLFCVSWCWFSLGEDFVNKGLGVVIFVESREQVLAFVKLRSFSVTVRG